jgi:hypothetical protein
MRIKDNFEDFKRYLNKANGEFQVFEHQIPIETQMEYFIYSGHLRELLPEDAEMAFDQFATALHDSTVPLEKKKPILSALAVSKDARGYRILQEYLKEPDMEIKDWANMALMECRVMLESELTQEKQIYISTGLGGKGNHLRFYILLLSTDGKPFLDYQRQVIEREFEYALRNHDSEIEELTFKKNYVELMVLVPIQTNVKRLVEKVISECNQYGNFIANTVTLTNVKKLSEKEVAHIIKKHERTRTST